jgi:acyl-CoA thioester hydrolase
MTTVREIRAVEIEVPIQIKPYEIDFAGVVSNIVYVRWMEDLRMAMISSKHQLPLMSLIEEGVAPAIVRTEVKYRRPLRLGDEVVGHMWFSHMDRRRATLRAEFRVDGKLAASAVQDGVFIRTDNFHFAPIPQSWRDIYQATYTE